VDFILQTRTLITLLFTEICLDQVVDYAKRKGDTEKTQRNGLLLTLAITEMNEFLKVLIQLNFKTLISLNN